MFVERAETAMYQRTLFVNNLNRVPLLDHTTIDKDLNDEART